MNFPCVVISKILSFSSQRDMQSLVKVFGQSSSQTKIICPFCITFTTFDEKLFNFKNEIPWYDIRYVYDEHRASRITIDRIDYPDDSFEIKMKSMEEINSFKYDECILEYHMIRYQARLNEMVQNPMETSIRLNEILNQTEIFDKIPEFITHMADRHDDYSRIFYSMLESNDKIASLRRRSVDYGIVLEGCAGEYRSILTQTILQGSIIMIQDKLPGSTQKHKLLPESLHKILALRDYLECFCDAVECRFYSLNREMIEAEKYFGRANALRLICNSILKYSY